MVADPADIAGTITSALALAHGEAGRIEEARHLLDEFENKGFSLSMDQLWLTGMTCYADAAIAVRDPKYAVPLFEQLAPWVNQLATDGAATASGPVSHYLGGLATVLGRFDEADAYFTQSAAMSVRMDAKFFAARTGLLWAGCLPNAVPWATPRRRGVFS